MTTHNNPIVLVDASSYLYRAFHVPALQALTNAKGEPTGAIFGVVNMLRKLRQDYEPEKMVCIFDAKGKTFRHELYSDYKANRPAMPEILQQQIEPLHSIIESLGYTLLVIPGVEADDVIGTLATSAYKENRQVIISSGDKDLAQLVNDQVSLVNTMTNSTLDTQGVIDKFGVTPEQITDYLALMGDKADNIPGVEKVGPKTAAKWLQEYGTLEKLLENAESIKGKVGDNLRKAITHLPLSKKLAMIDKNLDLGISWDDINIQDADTETLKVWFEKLEFKTWLKELDTASTASQATKRTKKYQTILSESAFKDWLKKLEKADYFAFDTETTGLNYMQAELVGISFAVNSGEAAYVPLTHSYPSAPEQLSLELVLKALKPILEDTAQKKIIGQHIKYDRNILARYNITLSGIKHDTMLESYVLNSTATRHDMDSLAKKYLDIDTIHYEDIAGKGAKQLTFDQIDIETASEYAAEDAEVTLQLHETLHAELQKEPDLAKVYYDIEQPLISVLSQIECNGVAIDGELLNSLSQQFEKQMQTLEAEAHKNAGSTFNLNSPKQIQQILFEQQGLPIIRKTPKGQPSTAEDVLQELADQGHALPELIVSYRGLSKLRSTYTDKLPMQIDSNTGRVHTSYHQAVASTGRLSSTDPNLQNIPIRNENGRAIRKAFIAPPGKLLMASDYSQIELRIMAHLSDDKRLLEAFSKGVDIHKATAAEVFATDNSDVSSEQRRAAKAINFGLIYGMSAFGLAKQLSISRKDAQNYVDLYFERYPGVKQYMDSTRELAHQQGYVETLFNRRLYLPEINSRNAGLRQYAERTAINAPMQGTAADIIKLAMISVHDWLSKNHSDTLLIMQVHDELVFEVPAKKIEAIKAKVEELMVSAASLKIPLEVESGVGANWDEAH